MSEQTTYTKPDESGLKPLLKSARKVGGRKWPNRHAVALYSEDGELIAGPMHISSGYVEWSTDGLEIAASGPFTSYDDLRQAWKRAKRQRQTARSR